MNNYCEELNLKKCRSCKWQSSFEDWFYNQCDVDSWLEVINNAPSPKVVIGYILNKVDDDRNYLCNYTDYSRYYFMAAIKLSKHKDEVEKLLVLI